MTKTNMGEKLIDTIENFKKEVLNVKRIEIEDLPLIQKNKILKSIEHRKKEIAKREKDRRTREKSA